MRISSLAPETFTPNWKENQDLPPKEQIQVTVRFPSAQEFEPYGGDLDLKKTDAIGMVRDFTEKITNFEILDQKIVDGTTLVECRKNVVSGLITEIFLYILSGTELGEKREKN